MRRTLPIAAAIVCFAAPVLADDPATPPTPPPSAANELPTFEKVEPRKPPPQVSLLFGLRLGPALVAGDLLPATKSVAGADIGVDIGTRFLKQFYAGLTFDGIMMFYGRDTGTNQSANVAGFGFGVMGGWLSHPEKVGLFAQLGLGTHMFAISTETGRAETRTSAELRTMVGLTFRIATIRIVVPRVDIAAGGGDGLGHALFTFGLSAAYEYELFKRPHSD
jgi:hypothetical protein